MHKFFRRPRMKALVWGMLIGAIALLSTHLAPAVSGETSAYPPLMEVASALPPIEFSRVDPFPQTSAHEKGTVAGELPAPPSIANAPAYTPREVVTPADPSNYGPRYLTDVRGNPVSNALIVVIHETVGSADSAIRMFQTRHERDADQVSYHSLIRRDGTIVHLVHPQMRAFGAGNSVFVGSNGPEAVQTNPNFPPSVNNFAYHTSLETPGDGRGNQSGHSGYTDAQYQSLAWLIARLPVPDERITTHRAVDRSGQKRDPRSFNSQRFSSLLHAYPRLQARQGQSPILQQTS